MTPRESRRTAQHGIWPQNDAGSDSRRSSLHIFRFVDRINPSPAVDFDALRALDASEGANLGGQGQSAQVVFVSERNQSHPRYSQPSPLAFAITRLGCIVMIIILLKDVILVFLQKTLLIWFCPKMAHYIDILGVDCIYFLTLDRQIEALWFPASWAEFSCASAAGRQFPFSSHS